MKEQQNFLLILRFRNENVKRVFINHRQKSQPEHLAKALLILATDLALLSCLYYPASNNDLLMQNTPPKKAKKLMCSGRFGSPYKRLELYVGGSRIMWNLPVMGIAVFSFNSIALV